MTAPGPARPRAGRRRLGIVVGVAGLLLAVVAGCRPAAAANRGGWDVTVGFGGRFRAGSWTPLVVTATGSRPGIATGDRLHVWVEDPDGALVRSPPAVLESDAAGRPAARFRVRPGRPDGRLVVGGTTGPRVELRLPAPIPSTHGVVLVVGDLAAARRAVRLVRHGDSPPLEVVPLAAGGGTAAAAEPRDYDSADRIVVCGNAVADVDDAVLRGIDAWVRRGGRLVFAAGVSAAAVHAAGGPAAGWLPGPIDRLVPLRRLGAIESFARTAGLAGRATALRVPVLAGAATGTIDVFEGAVATDLPLVVRRTHGLGTIAWAALDLDADPFRDWPGTDEILARLLGGRPRDVELVRSAGAAGGPPDLAGQLRVALEDFGSETGWAGRGPVPFAIVLGLGIGYVLCLYPLEWRLVSRGRGSAGGDRGHLAWVTAPLLVGGFTTAAWAVADRWRPPAARAARAAEFIDVDAASGAIRGSAWSAVWRVGNDRLDIAVTPADAAAVSWWADAGTGFGGIDAAMPHPSLAVADYAYGPALDALEGVPVAAASDRLFEAEWSATGATDVVASTLAIDAQGTLRGTVAHRLPFALDDCRLAHGGWLYDVGRLAAGVAFDPQASRGPRSLAGALTRRAATGERDVVARWDAADTALERILEIAGFHAAAGGADYTRLEAGRLGRLDLSPVLAVDRAVLWGTAADVPPEWTTAWRLPHERPSVTRLYRIVIPLASASEPR
jgi:hypothetical protein